MTHAYTLLAVLLLFTVPAALAQRDDWCGTDTPAGYLAPHRADPEAFENFKEAHAAERAADKEAGRVGSCVTDYPLNVHVFRFDDGTGGLSATQVEQAIASINARFADACMAFYACGVTFVDDTELATYQNSDEADSDKLFDNYYDPEALNLYFAPTVLRSDGSGLCGFAYYPESGPNVIMMANSCSLNGSTLAHEIGHAYGLPHTHGPSNDDLTDELVDGSNCDTAGDGFCDTPADPQLSSGTVNSSCRYTGSTTDANNARFTPDPTLLMSYSRKSCRTRFSPEQSAAMRFNALTASDRRDITCARLTADYTSDRDAVVACAPGEAFTFTAAQATGAYAWDAGNDGTVDGTGRTFSFAPPATGEYEVVLTVSVGAETVRRVNTFSASVEALAAPNRQDFEPDSPPLTGYVVVAGPNGLSWFLGDGPTPSSDTGPSGGYDASGANAGGYVYLEASGTYAPGEEATFVTGCLAVPDATADPSPELSFRYHMFGARVGELHVDLETAAGIVTDVTPALVGQQTPSSTAAWSEREVDLSAYAGQAVRVMFRASYGGGFQGDIAVDAIAVGSAAPLPVELAAFAATAVGTDVRLDWSSASELNSSHYVVERAGADGAFAALGEVASANSAFGADYVYTDASAPAGESYYRLRAVDFDGAEELSGVRAVTLAEASAALRLYPNPTAGAVTVEGAAPGATATVRDYLGRVVATSALTGGRLDVSHLAAGVYRVAVPRGATTEVVRLVVAH